MERGCRVLLLKKCSRGEVEINGLNMDNKKPPDLTAKYLAGLHHGAKASTQQHARQLRHQQTKAEEKLWSLLRSRQLKGKKFRRQQAIANYVVDFYCNEAKLAIELDGNFHSGAEAKAYDESRTVLLNELGITVLRFWNKEVIDNPLKVLQMISEHLK